jgi:hypothetical protein
MEIRWSGKRNSWREMWKRLFMRLAFTDGLRVGRPGFDSRQGQDIFLLSTAARRALGPTQHPVQKVPWALPGIKAA